MLWPYSPQVGAEYGPCLAAAPVVGDGDSWAGWGTVEGGEGV